MPAFGHLLDSLNPELFRVSLAAHRHPYYGRELWLQGVYESRGDSRDQERNAIIAREYDRLFKAHISATSLKNTSTKDLRLIYRAASMAAYFIVKADYVNDMRLVLSAMGSDSSATEDDYIDLLRAIIQIRDFGGAVDLIKKNPQFEFPAVPSIPSDFTQKQFTAFDVSGPEKIIPVAIDISKGSYLVVIAHPLCHFSKQAVADIEKDEKFKSIFLERTIWLAPVSGNLYPNAFQDWNEIHTNAKILQIRYEADWPLITQWSTPQFYAINNGRVIAHVVGWPKEGNKLELLELLRTLD